MMQVWHNVAVGAPFFAAGFVLGTIYEKKLRHRLTRRA